MEGLSLTQILFRKIKARNREILFALFALTLCSLKVWIRRLTCKSKSKRENWKPPLCQRPLFIQKAHFPQYDRVLLKLFCVLVWKLGKQLWKIIFAKSFSPSFLLFSTNQTIKEIQNFILYCYILTMSHEKQKHGSFDSLTPNNILVLAQKVWLVKQILC